MARFLEVIFLESRSKLSHLGCREGLGLGLVAPRMQVEGPWWVSRFDSIFALVYREKLGKSCVLLVFFFFSKSSNMAAAGAIRRGHLPDGGI
jgi:hypothetical protein